ncbi:hypothetical protein CAPTEDRAFT_203035 [Capitella teleta]|uniref:TERF1-interacting nuclear factor 2 N-terminal domain-containing protein n=1 Tax=Capitella teleta TaxID=283909 RepID=R7TVW2_CAPTE|nr:hypothetical protein CAPTEDRAFT_203035 [Capitella teleta]|eukprot:ELT95145.1 hypothetical protein CAPTEDRAFT_203035 [Capitella teleta]
MPSQESVFRVLRTDDPLITFEKLNAYFPRAAFQHPKASWEFSESITKRMAHFRAQFLQLTTSKTKKEEFFAHRFEQDYGEEFLCVVRRLCKEFCRRTQPSTTVIKEILNSPVGSKLISDLRAEKCIEINALLDACEVQQSHLNENEVLSLFHKIRSM